MHPSYRHFLHCTFRSWRLAGAVALLLLLAACGSTPPRSGSAGSPTPLIAWHDIDATDTGNEILFFSLGLIDTDYRFGGKNPEAGLDCSGMVSYVYLNAARVNVRGSAADIARKGRVVSISELRVGDLIFFNTLGRAYSHVGIYIGDGRFIDAPSTNGKVRIDRLDNRYYAQRFEEARRYFD
jgi:cell wall-associated NlpC family hydrolase